MHQQEESVMEMRSFDDSVMKACESLQDLTTERAKCLHTFVKCGKLVSWLRESMKKGEGILILMSQ